MAKCLECHKHYTEPEDEQGQHDCPYCMYCPHDDGHD